MVCIDKMNYKSNQYFLAVQNSTYFLAPPFDMFQKKRNYSTLCLLYNSMVKKQLLTIEIFFSDRAIISHCPNLFKQLCWGLMSKLFKFCYSQSLFKHVSFVSATHSVGHTVKMCTIVKYFAPAFNPR